MVHWFLLSLYEAYLYQEICCSQVLLSYLAGLCAAWSLAVQMVWVVRDIHASLVKTMQIWETCLVFFRLLHYLCLFCFPGMD